MKRLMRSLKNTFIPHEGNDHKPHILRAQTVVFVCLVAIAVESLFLFSSSYVMPRSKLFGIILVNALIDGTNSARASGNLQTLHVNQLLQAAAQEKADDMVRNNYFAHTSPSGVTPWYWFQNVGYSFIYAGENLAVNFSDSGDVTSAWLNSPTHRANILNAGFTEIGMATAQGTFSGHPAIYVVELFGKPSIIQTAITSETSPKVMPISVPAPTPKTPVAVATGSTQTFAAVKGVEVEAVPAAPEQNPIVTAAQVSNPIQKAAAEPRKVVDYVYLGIAILFAAALALNIFVKIHIQHPQLIMGGMLVVLVAGLFIVLNQHVAFLSTTIL